MSEREQVEAALNAIDDLRDWLKDEVVIAHYADSEKLRNRIIQMLDQYERRIKAMDSDSLSGTFSCPICDKDSPHEHTSQEVAEHRVSASRLPAPVSQPVAAQDEAEHKAIADPLNLSICKICKQPVDEVDDVTVHKPSPQAEPSESTETFYCFDREAGVSMCETQCATCRQKGSSQVSIADDASNGVYRAMLTSTAMEYARRNRHEKPTINDLYNAAIELLSRASQPSTLPQSSQQAQGDAAWATYRTLSRGEFDNHSRIHFSSGFTAGWTAAQSQPVAEIPQLVSDELLDDLIAPLAFDKQSAGYLAIQELRQYRQRFGKEQ